MFFLMGKICVVKFVEMLKSMDLYVYIGFRDMESFFVCLVLNNEFGIVFLNNL